MYVIRVYILWFASHVEVRVFAMDLDHLRYGVGSSIFATVPAASHFIKAAPKTLADYDSDSLPREADKCQLNLNQG